MDFGYPQFTEAKILSEYIKACRTTLLLLLLVVVLLLHISRLEFQQPECLTSHVIL